MWKSEGMVLSTLRRTSKGVADRKDQPFRIPISAFCSRGKSRRVPLIRRFGAADHELAAHENLIVQLAHGPLGLIDTVHLHKRKTLGSLGRAMGHDFRAGHAADPLEELGQIMLRGLERKIADVEARGSDLDELRLGRRPVRCRRGRPILRDGRSGRLLIFSFEEGDDALPERGGGLRAVAVTMIGTAPGAATAA